MTEADNNTNTPDLTTSGAGEIDAMLRTSRIAQALNRCKTDEELDAISAAKDVTIQTQEQEIAKLRHALDLALRNQQAPELQLAFLQVETVRQQEKIVELEGELVASKKLCQQYYNGESIFAELFNELCQTPDEWRFRLQKMHRRAQMAESDAHKLVRTRESADSWRRKAEKNRREIGELEKEVDKFYQYWQEASR